METKISAAAVAVGLLVLLSLPARAVIDTVTTCGQTLRGRSQLLADLHCEQHLGPTLYVRGKLYLNGYTIYGRTELVPLSGEVSGTIQCPGPCRVIGPGRIVAFDGFESYSEGQGSPGSVSLDDLILEVEPSRRAVHAFARLKVRDSTIVGRLTSTNIKIVNSDVSTSHRGEPLIWGRRVVVVDSLIEGGGGTNNQGGCIRDSTVVLKNSTLRNCGSYGVEAERVTLVDSVVAGNATHQYCNDVIPGIGFHQCGDLVTCRRPRLRGTSTCGLSRRWVWSDCRTPNPVLDQPWYVCTDDQ